MQNWYDVLLNSVQQLWFELAAFLPRFVLAVIVFVIGWLLAVLIYRGIVALIDAIKLDRLLAPTGLNAFVDRSGYKFSAGKIIGWLVKWFIIIAFLVASFNIVGWDSVNTILTQIALYIPRVILAAFVMFAGFIVADFVRKLVAGSTKVTRFGRSELIGSFSKIVILIFAFLIVLNLIGLAAAVVNSLIIGFVAMVALAGGIAFGLGGKDVAREMLESLHREVKED